MILEDLVKETVIGKLETLLEDVDHAISFQNQSNNQWNIVISFDLDKSNLNDAEKALLNAIMKHL